MRHLRLVLICFLAALAVTQGLVFAQSQANTGTIEGIVNDPSGRAVAALRSPSPTSAPTSPAP